MVFKHARMLMTATGAGAKRALACAVDIAFPPVCGGCGVLIASPGGVCAQCWTTLRLIERPYCEVLGLPFSRDIGKGILSAQAIAEPPVFDRLRSVALHEGVARTLVHKLKYLDRTDLAHSMGRWMLRASDGTVDACDVIIPVPLHRARLISRKFNQSAELARAMAKAANKPYLADVLIRTKRTSQQVGLGKAARQDNVRGAFRVRDHALPQLFGKRVVLVDDVYTTGATVSAATRVLKRAGVADVTVLTFARALAAPI